MTREIKGPKDCARYTLVRNLNPAQMMESPTGEFMRIEEVGQIIHLALEAGSDRPSPELRNTNYERYSRREAEYQAWNDLAERLKI